MGLFKESLSSSVPCCNFLTELGFNYGEKSGPQGQSGYTKTVSHNGNEVLWITINTQEKKVYLYNEWECGGKLWSITYDIPESIFKDEMKFINWLDEII